MSKARKRKRDLALIYEVNNVATGFDYWYFKLLNYILGIFEYSGLPDSLPGRELESNLMLTGHAAVFKNKGNLVTTITTLYGFDEYYRPTHATFGNALIPFKNLKLGKDAEVIYNNKIRGNILRDQSVDGGLTTYIQRYARNLADIESTINIYITNSRLNDYPMAKNQQMAIQLRDFYNRIALGERAVLTDPSFFDAFRNIEMPPKRVNDSLNDFLIARDKILSQFFQEIGIKFKQEQKMAQMTEDEIVADEQLLVINLADMLEERQEGLERVNRHFGTNITVKINDTYDRTTYQKETEVNNNADTDDKNNADTKETE